MSACAACGQENPEGGRFCNACGQPLVAASAARDERKVVTVVFADFVGSTDRAERLDPEDVRALQGRGLARPAHPPAVSPDVQGWGRKWATLVAVAWRRTPGEVERCLATSG